MRFPSPGLFSSVPRSCAARRAVQRKMMLGWTMGRAASPGPAPMQPSGLGCCDASMLFHGNLERGPANSSPTTVLSSDGDKAGSGPPSSVAKRQRLRSSSVLVRAIVCPPPLSFRLFILDVLQEWDGARSLLLLEAPWKFPVELGPSDTMSYKTKQSPSSMNTYPGCHLPPATPATRTPALEPS